MTISLLAYIATFSGHLYFWRNYFFTLLQSNYFDTTVTFFGGAISSEQLLFLRCSFFRTVTYSMLISQQLFFQSETSTEQSLFENKTFFKTLSFRDSYLFGRGIVQNKDLYRRATSSKQVLLLHTYWKKRTFQNNIPHYLFLESYLFGATTFSKNATFYSSYLFSRSTF